MCAQNPKEVIILYFVKKENHYKIVYFNLWEKWGQKTKCCIYIFVYLVQYLQFVLDALKWPKNLAGLKLVFNKLGVLWQPHWLCVLYWAFTANFTPPHTLQCEISCRHTPCWFQTYQHLASLSPAKLAMPFFPAERTYKFQCFKPNFLYIAPLK